jgi:hypothetical protein
VPVYVSEMDPEVRAARRFRVQLEFKPKPQRYMCIRVPCEFCGQWVDCSGDEEFAVCARCTHFLSLLD